MKLKKALQGLVKAILDEAEQNPAFAQKVEAALDIDRSSIAANWKPKRSTVRRTPAILDPIDTVRLGEQPLRHRLASLSVEQLKDIVADYGMDPGKLVMKWNSPQRIIDRIVEFSLSRATKGDAFLK